MFSDNTLEEIRARMNIVDLVAEYLPLKKSGSGFTAICPFHKEKTPSFHVHPVKQVFHCFGCHKGGNVFTFLRLIEGISFPETVRKLAERTGVELKEDERRKSPGFSREKAKENSRPLQALEWATKYFHYLLTEVDSYRFAKEYLKSRGISDKTIKKFRIGVAPRGWHTTSELMLKREFRTEDLESAGLIIKKSSGNGHYDRFRERLMFPIHDPKGTVIGFGARILKEEKDQPKYLNSPESKFFNKREQLYGLHENQREIRLKGEAVLVEGYMDVVGLYEKEVGTAVATMGTALTEEHCRTLRGHTRRVVTVFDPDQAGKDAWHRSVDIFIRGGIFAKDLALPEGLDPDEFVQKYSAEAFFELSQKAPRQITKLLKEIAAQGSLSEEERAHWIERLTPILIASRRLPDRALVWDSLSMVLNVSIEVLKELSQPSAAQSKRQQKPTAPPKQTNRQKRPTVPKLDPIDLEFFAAAIAIPEDFQKTAAAQWLEGIKGTTIREHLLKLHQCGSEEFQKQLQSLQTQDPHPQLQDCISRALIQSPPKNANEVFADMLGRVSKRRKEFEIKALSKQVRLNQRIGSDEEAQLLLLEKLKKLRADP